MLREIRPALPLLVSIVLFLTGALSAQPKSELDQKVRAFLASREGTWRDMNVPETDGQTLHDLVLKNKYKRALEIGTSTGHSGIWIAWALAKTGGKLITIDIDGERHREAVANFRAAGLADYVDARLADAHELVPKLPGPFDFVFSDADKDWYVKYAEATLPKLTVGGCFVAHNVSEGGGWRRGGWVADFVDFLKKQPNLETTFDSRGGGMSISFKRAK
ncbi:MAG: methyltransferase [Acidobacteria bacterium]|nr:MAG: methyltransferase [Acidobacteriota bacterium]